METANLEQAQVSYNQGLAHLKSGNLDAVIECFREALLLNPNFAEVHNTIGLIQFQIEKYENAIQLFDNALAMNPNFAEAYNNRGLARSKICHKSEFPKVIEDYTKAKSIRVRSLGGVSYYSYGKMRNLRRKHGQKSVQACNF